MRSRSYTYFKEIYFSLFVLLVIMVAGMAGYILIESFSFSEALYMTIITVSTVGFQEVRPLSDTGQYFTALLIVTSFGTFAYAATSVTRNIISGQYRRYFKNFNVYKKIDKLKGHVIVCGYGRNGQQAVKMLRAYGQQFVVIERHKELLETLHDSGALFVEGDATNEEILGYAGISRAKALITTLPKDTDNVFVVLTAREMNKSLTIISRASEESSDKKLKIAGADSVIIPERVGGTHMASLVVSPDTLEFLNSISALGNSDTNLEEIHFRHIPEQFHNKTIQDLSRLSSMDCLIIGYKTPSGEFIVNPDPERLIVPGSKLFVLGKPQQIHELNDIFDIST